MIVATRLGEVKKTKLDEFSSVRTSGLIAMDLEKGDDLIAARIAKPDDEVLMVTEKGQSIKFPVLQLRSASRSSGGVRGIRLVAKDKVIGMDIVDPKAHMLVITSKGFGKMTLLPSYPLQKRGGSGVRTFKIVPKTGDVVSARLVYPNQELVLISANGIVIRTSVSGIPAQGRDTQGVTIMRIEEGDSVASVGCITKE